jgi:electron transport complex protein RnfG
MPTQVKRAGPFRLIATLGVAGFFSGLVLVGVYIWSNPLILENQRVALERAVYKVLPGATTRKIFVLQEGQLAPFQEEGGSLPTEAVFGGYDGDGNLVGFGIPSEGPGFQDNIRLIYGYNPTERTVIGMEVLESKETPGLGDKIFKDQDFVANFSALKVDPEVVAVASGKKSASHEVDSISGATISSKAVVKIINQGNEQWLELIDSMIKAGEQN